MKTGVWRGSDVLASLPELAPERRYVEPFEHGTMRLGMYAPRGSDPQQPHDQDELYFVLSGSGRFVGAGGTTEIGPGDALFVASGETHRFEDFSEDFSAWVVFWGPKGGE